MANIATTYDEDVLIKELGYDDHFHDHHHGDKYQSGFISHYIFSMDHKIILYDGQAAALLSVVASEVVSIWNTS